MIFKIGIFAILVVALFVDSGNAILTCYGCVASKTSDCFNGIEKSYITQECIPATDNMLPFTNLPTNMTLMSYEEPIKTVCIQFGLKDHNQIIYQRGCGFIYESVDICEYLGNLVTLDECSFCEEDLCNKNPNIVRKHVAE